MLKRKKLARRVSVGLSGLVMAGSALTLLGWGAGLRRLTDWFDHDISQLPNNAVGVFAAGAATLLLALGHRRASASLALIAGLIGGATLLQHLAGVDLGIDRLLLTHNWGHSATVHPGRMGIPGSASLLFTGIAILLSLPERTRGWSAAGGLAVIAIAAVSIIGYLFGAKLFYSVPYLTTVALQTALLLLALGLALLTALPDRKPISLLIENSAAALMVVRSLPGIVLVPALIGWATLQGQRVGLFDHAFATAAMTLVLTLLLSALLWRTAEAVRRHGLALSHSEERLSAMLGSITDAFMTLDSQWRYVFVNDHSQTHWGKSPQAMLGSTIWKEFPEAVGSEAYRQLHRAMQERVTVEYEYFHEPMQKWYGSRAYPTEGGGLAVYSRDITVQKRHEQQLRQLADDLGDANKRKSAFLATLAHELRNPLAPIVSGLELLKRGTHEPAVVERTRQVMERQALQLVRLIDDLLDMGRIDADKLDLRMDRVALSDILEQALEACGPALERSAHVTSLSLPPMPIMLRADELRMVQVFVNLLNNACKFTGPNGRIDIEASVDGQHAVVTVRDTGIGIPVDKLEEIFGMFSQVDQSLEREQQGLGIGLTLVQRMVQLHGGSVSAHSAGPGRGSTFTVRLPTVDAESPAATSLEPPVPAAAAAAKRVLVVDDNRDAADTVAVLLSLNGHAVDVVYDGEAALERVQAFAPDVVLLDIGMPGMSGYDVCRAVRSMRGGNRIRVVALTGWGKDEDRERSDLAGFDAHLVKPVDAAALMAAICPSVEAGSQSEKANAAP